MWFLEASTTQSKFGNVVKLHNSRLRNLPLLHFIGHRFILMGQGKGSLQFAVELLEFLA